MKQKNIAIVVAAGSGIRFGASTPKVFAECGGLPLIAHCLKTLESSEYIDQVILVTGKDFIDYCQTEIVAKYKFRKVEMVVPGGKERQDSVREGLKNIYQSPNRVLIQDGARPFLSEAMIASTIEGCQSTDGAVIGTKITDTIKQVKDDMTIQHTVPRQMLWAVQTPQTFKFEVLIEAYQWAFDSGITWTDDAGLVEQFGKKVTIIPGVSHNIKVTTPEDLVMAQLIWEYHAKLEGKPA